ncbi:PP2C family serine/threonine-protein phosphatase [Chryseobacterium lactis]|nr:protein phosphatase 2C domain-containing protein [Chryseobacterium lactis]
MDKSVIEKEKEEFREAHWVLKNASSKQFYEFCFDMDGFSNIKIKNIENLEETGLVFESDKISGIPAAANVYNLTIEFYHTGDPKNLEIKKIQLFVNANPKDLWKNIPADKNADFYKPDEASFKGKFSDKKIVIASKRGRSHAHEGKFREDDFSVLELPSGWNIISISDGAGSAKLAREGSRVAVNSINHFFNSYQIIKEVDENIQELYSSDTSCEIESVSRQNILRLLYQGTLSAYQSLEKIATENNLSVNDLNATLIFALVKKFSFGYVILTFGVGDCPINLINSDFSKVQLLNTMDVGEFSGGTRFITMKEIFSEKIVSRFGITCVDNFSHLVLMTDGIYDAKFATENKLEDLESWKTFFNDLSGNNDDQAQVDFTNDIEIEQQLLDWSDFWSRGNHDDRTLAIIY